MVFLDFVVVVIAVVIAAGIVTQIVIPALRGTKLFPILRRERKLVGELTEEHQREAELDIEEQINELEREQAARKLKLHPPKQEPTEPVGALNR